MRDRGWLETESPKDWDIFWADVTWVHETFDQVYLQENQKVNHFRNHYELTRKDLLVKNVKRMVKNLEKHCGPEEAAKFDFVCPSFVLPQDYALFQEQFKKSGGIWIMKPVGRAQGRGIFLINKMGQVNQWRKDPKSMTKNNPPSKKQMQELLQLKTEGDNGCLESGVAATPPEAEEKQDTYIIQKYIENPLLVGGKKFDLRIYALVTSHFPLVVYIHRNGFCRFSNSQFSIAPKDISNLYIHATNVAVQKTAPNYDNDKGCKWLLRNLKRYISSQYGADRANQLMTDIEALIVRSLLCVQRVLIQDKNCFELYGYDILIDDNLKPWCLEVNASPSLTAETSWDYDLKHNMLNDMFDIIDFEHRNTAFDNHDDSRLDHKTLRQKVGGFDLVYNDGPVEHSQISTYKSFLGSWHPIPKAPRNKKAKSSKSRTSVSGFTAT